MRQETCLVLTGATGRVGRLLNGAWRARPIPGLCVIRLSRGGGGGVSRWDIGAGPAPEWPAGAVVVHLAGATGGDERALSQNVAMVAPLVAACRQNRVAALLFASTAAVYAPSAGGAREEDTPAPAGAYGRSKLKAERALADGLAASGIRLLCLRIGNVVGADALIGGAAAGGQVILDPVPGQAEGPIRSWVGPVTLAGIIARLARHAATGGPLPDILNVANDPPLGMAGLLEAARIPWGWGPPDARAVPAAVLSLARLRLLCDLPPVTAADLVAELALAREGEGTP